MEKKLTKKYPTIACCGLDCGLCPTYYTKGPSKCPGCCGSGFFNKHPSCSILNCCVKRNNFETCAECNDFPCSKILKWDLGDSFISHRVSLSNLNVIKKNGLQKFIESQKKRITILEIMLEQYNEGRSKSFFCIATALLSIENLEYALKICREQNRKNNISLNDLKSRSKFLKDILNDLAFKGGIQLKLRKN